MRWNRKSWQHERIRKKFLWFPRCINRECRGLERAVWLQRHYPGPQPWGDIRWLSPTYKEEK